MSKYDVTGSQGLYQPDSNNLVLANKLGITEVVDINEAELVLLEKIYEDVLINRLPQGAIKLEDIKTWHRRWLGNIYEWAGDERSVNMSKGDFHFAAAAQIPQLLNKFESEYLNRYTPCIDVSDDELIAAIAVVHIEFILIHPFREGNGRLSRLLADAMAVQSGYQPLDYSSWDENKNEYFTAIQQGIDMNYEPMKKWVARALEAN
ncbi:MAG: Fic/DOC family protein [Thiohalomonadales bacterium]